MKDKIIIYEVMACKNGVYHPFITNDYRKLIKDKLDPEGWNIITITKITREIIRRKYDERLN